MNTETKIALLKSRQQTLLARGPYNLKLVAKLERQIRALQNGKTV